MDFKAIDAAIAHYTEHATDEDKARYDLFRGLWQIQQDEAERLAAAYPYEADDEETLENHYWEGVAAFLQRPVTVDADQFAAVCTSVAGYLAEHAGFDEQAAQVLVDYDWASFAGTSALELAGKDPAGYVEDCLRRIDDFDVDASCPSNVFMMVPTFALRAFLQEPAARVMEGLSNVGRNQLYHNKPLRCPACGSPASTSYVGGGLELESHERGLYCSMCGSAWPFERIRCGCCGTRNQGSLHWFHVEGDPAHRLHKCDECGDYMRTTFQNDLHAALCMEVEDVAMAYLDRVAQSLK